LAKLDEKAPIQMWIQPGSFEKLPLHLNEKGRFGTPILCIGSGTGIAPLRSLILEREAVFKKARENLRVVNSDDDDRCDNLLVFGCRKESVDYYYRDDWDALVSAKRLFVWTAFSRDQWHKIYVQQVLRSADDGKLVEKHILEHQGAIYVAGGAKMARCVKEEILECLAKAVGGEKQASLLLKRMHLQGRYSVEAWS
jgi:sulfite reductase alpha subunit-like flavoprotein